VYRQARNAVCADLLQASMPPEADAATDPAGAVAMLEAFISRANEEIGRLSALTVPASLRADEIASIDLIRATLPLLQQEIDLINQGKIQEAAAVDEQTAPLSERFQQFEQKYGLAACP
jgi:hypothetical protein